MSCLFQVESGVEFNNKTPIYLEKLFCEIEKDILRPTNIELVGFLSKITENFFIDDLNLLKILDHMEKNITNYLWLKISDNYPNGFNDSELPIIRLDDLDKYFSPKLISFLYHDKVNLEYKGKIDRDLMIYRIFFIVFYRELSCLLFKLGHFRQSLTFYSNNLMERRALKIWLLGESKKDFLNTNTVISDINSQNAQKGWKAHNEQRKQLKERYLATMRKGKFASVTSATDHIHAKENPEKKKYRWIYDRLTEATKGNFD